MRTLRHCRYDAPDIVVSGGFASISRGDIPGLAGKVLKI
jgi:hypothetical protein